MRYVLDASVALKWVLPEPGSPTAIALRDEFRLGAHELIAPDIFPAEIGHGLTKAERKGVILRPEASVRLAALLRLLPLLYPILPDLLPRAVAVASQHRIGVYDCLYVALAEREACELVTADDKLVKNLGPHFPFIRPLAAVP